MQCEPSFFSAPGNTGIDELIVLLFGLLGMWIATIHLHTLSSKHPLQTLKVSG